MGWLRSWLWPGASAEVKGLSSRTARAIPVGATRLAADTVLAVVSKVAQVLVARAPVAQVPAAQQREATAARRAAEPAARVAVQLPVDTAEAWLAGEAGVEPGKAVKAEPQR